MKHLFSIPFVSIICSFTLTHAQNLKIAVVDMEAALKEYHRTAEEVEKINNLGEIKIRNIDERKAVYEKMTSDMVRLDRQATSKELSEEKKREAYGQLQEMARARNAKANEIGDAERAANQELFEARQKMEAMLLGEIKAAVQQIVAAKGYDMVFDKSFLPKASKSIVYISPRVPDVTDEVINRLNGGR